MLFFFSIQLFNFIKEAVLDIKKHMNLQNDEPEKGIETQCLHFLKKHLYGRTVRTLQILWW